MREASSNLQPSVFSGVVKSGNFRGATADDLAGVQWWNQLPEAERAFWLCAAETAIPWCAWNAWKRHQAVRARWQE